MKIRDKTIKWAIPGIQVNVLYLARIVCILIELYWFLLISVDPHWIASFLADFYWFLLSLLELYRYWFVLNCSDSHWFLFFHTCCNYLCESSMHLLFDVFGEAEIWHQWAIKGRSLTENRIYMSLILPFYRDQGLRNWMQKSRHDFRTFLFCRYFKDIWLHLI